MLIKRAANQFCREKWHLWLHEFHTALNTVYSACLSYHRHGNGLPSPLPFSTASWQLRKEWHHHDSSVLVIWLDALRPYSVQSTKRNGYLTLVHLKIMDQPSHIPHNPPFRKALRHFLKGPISAQSRGIGQCLHFFSGVCTSALAGINPCLLHQRL